MNNNKEKEVKNRIHTACEPHLDKYFPKTNYDDPSKPSTGKRAEALALYGLMIGEFLSELQRRENETWKKASDIVLGSKMDESHIQEHECDPLDGYCPHYPRTDITNMTCTKISSTLLSQVKE